VERWATVDLGVDAAKAWKTCAKISDHEFTWWHVRLQQSYNRFLIMAESCLKKREGDHCTKLAWQIKQYDDEKVLKTTLWGRTTLVRPQRCRIRSRSARGVRWAESGSQSGRAEGKLNAIFVSQEFSQREDEVDADVERMFLSRNEKQRIAAKAQADQGSEIGNDSMEESRDGCFDLIIAVHEAAIHSNVTLGSGRALWQVPIRMV
jgi:hypothetical protein